MSSSPLVSVIIPTYNCRRFLGRTLRSVLEQDPGPKIMEIAVIDDCSEDRPEEVVNAVGEARVAFHRNPENVGLTANFNACVDRAQGRIIHILHGDDRVRPGFYDSLMGAYASCPDLSMFVCQSYVIDEDDLIVRLDGIHPLGSSGAYGQFYHLLVPLNPIRTPAVALAARTYRKSGGFDPRFVHCTDWHMWLRAASAGTVWYEHQPLAEYRIHSHANSRSCVHTGSYLTESFQCVEAWIRECSPRSGSRYRRKARLALIRRAVADLRHHRFSDERIRLIGDLLEKQVPEVCGAFRRLLSRERRSHALVQINRHLSHSLQPLPDPGALALGI